MGHISLTIMPFTFNAQMLAFCSAAWSNIFKWRLHKLKSIILKKDIFAIISNRRFVVI